MSLASLPCCVAGCGATIDPRWRTSDADGVRVPVCDGHGELHHDHVHTIDPERRAACAAAWEKRA